MLSLTLLPFMLQTKFKPFQKKDELYGDIRCVIVTQDSRKALLPDQHMVKSALHRFYHVHFTL